jgi:rsbT co-antagonist protein RsbR
VEALCRELDAAVGELELACAGGDPRATVERLLPLLRRLGDAAASIDGERAVHEAVQEQFSIQRELILALGCPILQVRADVLCVPLVGPYDLDRAAQLRDAVLQAVARTRARLVVLDLTGAQIPEPSAAAHVLDVCRAIRLLGARAALSGINPQLAQMLVGEAAGLHEVSIYLSLETAITAART